MSRRRALGLGGTVGLAGVLAACGTTSGTSTTASITTTAAPVNAAPVGDDIVALLDRATTWELTKEETQGPYWFDVDSIRSDVRENRPGAELTLALRVRDERCAPVPNAVVEIWHCDAGGVYSGFESGSQGANGGGGGGQGGPPPGRGGQGGQGGPPPGGDGEGGGGGGGGGMEGDGEESNGSYSAGDTQATTTDDGTYLRDTRNDTDGIYDASGLMLVQARGAGHLAVLNLGVST